MLKSASQSLTDQLASRFAERIRNHLLAPGERLPSVRLCAQQQSVSASTVVAAYDQLVAHWSRHAATGAFSSLRTSAAEWLGARLRRMRAHRRPSMPPA